MQELIRDRFLPVLDNPVLRQMSDAAEININKERFAFTTDSFVVKPLFFPGGDIGKLSVCGTVNDISVQGGKPLYISCAIIVEEGFDIQTLDKIVKSIGKIAREAGIKVVAGDFKVVEKGSCDGIFINTAGIGIIKKGIRLHPDRIEADDKVIITGNIAQHGFCILSSREGLGFKIRSDCAALDRLLLPLLDVGGIRFMRDPTRGGVVTTLNEIAELSGLGIIINEESLPISGSVRACAELTGIDPLHLASEGAAIVIVDDRKAQDVLEELHKNPLGRSARIVGEVVTRNKKNVYLKTSSGGLRIIEMPSQDPLPRIC